MLPHVQRNQLRQYDRDNGQAGLIVPSQAPLTSATALTASRAHVARFVPSRPMSITKIGFVVSTAAGSDDACDVGLYDAAWARLVSAGATSAKMNVLGFQTVSFTATLLQAGVVYYAAFSLGAVGSSAASLILADYQTTTCARAFGAVPPTIDADIQSSGTPHPLPVTFVGGVAPQRVARLWVME